MLSVSQVMVDTDVNMACDVMLFKIDVRAGYWGMYNFYKMQVRSSLATISQMFHALPMYGVKSTAENNTLETKAMTTSSHCNTGIIIHYHKRKHFPSCTRCSENHNNTSVENRKIRGLKFDTLHWRHVAANRKT